MTRPHNPETLHALECCCCGSRTQGRQWFNRDTGYGLCLPCARKIEPQAQDGQTNPSYGVRGHHYAIPETA
jgi:hypothetical protein